MTPCTTMQEYGVAKTQQALDVLVPALCHAAEALDEGSVHKLRVSIRRFQQSMRLFKQYLRGDGVQRIKADLKGVMDLAGELRNRDIAIGLVSKARGATAKLESERAEGRPAACTSGEGAGYAVFGRILAKRTGLGGAMKRTWKDSLNLQDNLRRRMPKLASRYFAEGRQATFPGTTWEHMHAFRLQTKRFRYTLELFRDAYGPALDRRIDSLKKVQDYLGDMNDCHRFHNAGRFGARPNASSETSGFESFEAA